MITIDQNLLKAIGVNLPEDQLAKFTGHVIQTLEERVGIAIMELLDDEEAAELIALNEAGDETAVAAWLEENLPEYKEVIQDEFDILMGEIAENADQF